MLSEYNQGLSKCLNHYLANEIDKLILQLNQQVDLEPFYCSIVPLFSEDYLQSDFFRLVWKYGSFCKLSKLYAEKCIALKIFNYEFGSWTVENFVSMKESVVILCESTDYLKLFKDVGLGFVLVNRINLLIKGGDENGIDLLDFLVYYADKTSFDLLETVEIKLENASKDYTELGMSKNDRFKGGVFMHSSLIYNTRPFEHKASGKESIKMDTPDETGVFLARPESDFSATSFLFMIYKRVKSVIIRQKVIAEAVNLTVNGVIDPETMTDLLLEFIKIDCCSVHGMLNEFQESVWEPHEIVEIMVDAGILNGADKSNILGNAGASAGLYDQKQHDCSECVENVSLGNVSDITQGSDSLPAESKESQDFYAFSSKDSLGISSIDPLIITFGGVDSAKNCSDGFFAHVLPTLKSVLKDESLANAVLKSRFVKPKLLKSSTLFSVLKDKIADVRLFALVLFFNETLIFNHFGEIIAKIEKKDEFIKLVLSKIAYDDVSK